MKCWDKEQKAVHEKSRIILRTEGKCNCKALGNEIWIVGALVDDTWIYAEDIFDHTWNQKMRMVGWNNYTENIPLNVWGELVEGKRIILVFESNRWRGKCEIEYGEKVISIDTYKDKDNSLMFVELKDEEK